MGTNKHTNSLRIPLKIIRIFFRILLWFFAIVGFVTIAIIIAIKVFMPSDQVNPAAIELARSAAAEGKLAYKLTVPEDMKKMFGLPKKEITINDGGMQKLILEWPGINAAFTKMRDYSAPFTLIYMMTGGKTISLGQFTDTFGSISINIGQNKPIVLRNENDLTKFDPFWGFAGVSLEKLDLRNYAELLSEMPFDSRTIWPDSNNLPDNFNPSRIVEESKNPGLGVRELHKQGIDGHGVGIAIIDQPLLINHSEYKDAIVKYEKIDVLGVSTQMHGPPVSSIAVGTNCGVAPKAMLYYFAVPTWKWLENKPWSETIEKIIELNKNLDKSKKIRVISISLGAFSQRPNYELWKNVVERANKNGILVVTCDPEFLKFGTLKHIENKSYDDPENFKKGRYVSPGDELLVPAGNRTTASHYGTDVYTYWKDGGMSWAVPYLAGLAVLAYQVNPEIEPQKIVELWLKTASRTDAGPIVNPIGFIEAVREEKQESKI